MTGIEPGWQAPPEMRGERSSWHDDREALRRYLAEAAR